MADLQTLFSIEVDVDFIHIQPAGVICRIPAVAFRLMDFPTLLIHHVSPGNVDKIKETLSNVIPLPSQLRELKDHKGNFVFKKGKSCLFKSNIDNLLGHLSNTPLYVMILDMWPSVPKLVGNCSVPLQSTIEDIVADVERTGISVPTVHGAKDIYKVYNLMGSEIGYISLGFKLLSLGAGLMSHIPEASITKPLSSRENNNIKEIKSSKMSVGKISKTKQETEDIVLEDIEVSDTANKSPLKIVSTNQVTEQLSKGLQSATTQKQHHRVNQKEKVHKKHATLNHAGKDEYELGLFVTNTVCPPPLFFNSKCDDLENKPDNSLVKKAPLPEPEECQGSISSADYGEAIHHVYPSDSHKSESARKVHMNSQCKPSKVVKEPSPERCNVGVQISPDVRTVASGLINQNLPILAALLRELSVLQGNRPVNSQHSSSPSQKIINPRQQPGSLGKIVRNMQDGVEPDRMQTKTELKQSNEVQDLSNERHRSAKKKTKLKFGITNSQKLRLQRNNPQLLQTLEKEESKEKRDKLVRNATCKTSKTNVFERQMRRKEEKQKLDVSSQESESNKDKVLKTQPISRPVPAPRQSKESLSSKSNATGTVKENEEIKSYMRVSGIHKSTDNEMSENEKNSYQDSRDGSQTSSRRIEVHIPSVSNDTIDSDSDRTDDFTDQSEADISIGHVSPKKTIQYPGFGDNSGMLEVTQDEPGKEDPDAQVDMESKPFSKDQLSAKHVKRIEVLPKPEVTIESADFEQTTEATDGDVLEGAQFEYNYSTDFDVGDDNVELEPRNEPEVLEYAEFEGSYSYDFEADDHSRGNDVRPHEVVDDLGVDSIASLSTTTSSSDQSGSQRILGHPMPHSSRLQKGSLAMPKPTLSSKSPLPNKKTGYSSGVVPTTTRAAVGSRRNTDVPLTARSSANSEFLTGDSDILQSTAGTGRTKTSDDYDRSYSDLLSDASKEF